MIFKHSPHTVSFALKGSIDAISVTFQGGSQQEDECMLGVYTPPKALYDGEIQSQLFLYIGLN